MAAFMKGYESQTYALLRIVTGSVFLWHGSQKLFGFPGTSPGEAPAFVIWIAGPIEFVGGALVMVGLFTRWAAFLCSGLMAAAYWMAHGSQKLFPLFPPEYGGNGGVSLHLDLRVGHRQADLVGAEPEFAVRAFRQAKVGGQHGRAEQVVRPVAEDGLEHGRQQGEHDQHADDDRARDRRPVLHEADPEQLPGGSRDRTFTG